MAFTLSIDDSIKKAWPDTCLGCLTWSAAVKSSSPEFWQYFGEHTARKLEQELAQTPLPGLPGIGEARAAYKAFGVDTGKHRVSSEALYRRLRQGKALYRINSVVDANNLVSLESGFSLGSYDAANLGESVTFRLGRPGEFYEGIGKAAIALENMPLLADAAGPFGGPSSDSTRAMITPDTTRGFTIIYSFSGREALRAALELTVERFSRFAATTTLEKFLV